MICEISSARSCMVVSCLFCFLFADLAYFKAFYESCAAALGVDSRGVARVDVEQVGAELVKTRTERAVVDGVADARDDAGDDRFVLRFVEHDFLAGHLLELRLKSRVVL